MDRPSRLRTVAAARSTRLAFAGLLAVVVLVAVVRAARRRLAARRRAETT
ncbi:hypothetical protein ACFQRB_06735 [Halobaculum litoreum]|uniref:Uncharacterized protein n=1 Tax=Halobaculum litoreum TaxID=3031998 RepID=A0ABD5XMB4_9EURY